MSNDLIKKDSELPVIPQQAGKIYNVDNIQNFHHTSQFFMSGIPGKRGSGPQPVTYSTDYYNLIVYGNYPWFEETDHITFTKNVVLVEDDNIELELKERFSPLTPDAIVELKSFLCIFAYMNSNGARTKSEHQAIIGQLTDIKNRSNGIEIYMHPLFYVDQQPLNQIAEHLGIKGNRGLNELGHAHWSVKAINLIEVLRDSGLMPF